MQVNATAPWETALSWERGILGISNLAGVGTGFGSQDTWMQKELCMAFQKLEEREAGVIISRKSSSTLWQAPSTFHSLHWSFPLMYNVFYIIFS